MAYKVIILYQLYMPSYFLGTFTEYPVLTNNHVPERFRKRPNYNDDSSQPITRISYIRH